MANIVSTIGSSGRDYATLTLWDTNKVPANLVTDGNSYEADCYNDSEFTGSAFGAHTTDSSHVMLITTGAGQSFQDNASVRTNALKYNQSNGVAMKNTTGYTSVITLSNAIINLTIQKLQLSQQSASGANCCIRSTNVGSTSHLYKDIIAENLSPNSGCANIYIVGGKCVNVLGIRRNSTAGGPCFQNSAGTVSFIGCTAVRASNYTAGGIGFGKFYGSVSVISSASFGFTSATGGTHGTFTGSKNNGTDQSSIDGSSNQTSITYNGTTPFTQASDATAPNFIPIASTALAANGFLDSTNAPNDITGTARAASPTIGCWEIASSGSPAVPPSNLPMMGVG